MKYRLQAIDDDGHTIGEMPVEIDALKMIPTGGIVVFSLDGATMDSDLYRIRQELYELGKRHNREFIAIRAGDVSITWIPDGRATE